MAHAYPPQGYYLVGLKMLNVERSLAEEHYADLSSKPFFGALVCCGACVCSMHALIYVEVGWCEVGVCL